MTKREWKKWSDDNAADLAQSGLTARQAAILAAAYGLCKSGKEDGRLYLPIMLPDGIPVEYDSEEVCDLEIRGLIRREMSENGAKSITITKEGIEKRGEIFKEVETDTLGAFCAR